ncbi:ATP-binding protein [Tropicibacter naphthalenivorans]|uniref:histidine kinase n=1 Tax=Tropicibacter naphthalenivorans TaxID=441103 RepID=A0A0P1FZ24_9RHOB|nr:ATP-binding protein [Tropicibacter naphthalenivorans]CUH74675.1 Phytochrome-like protein cph1 [Tropicibacter naphthalenivorans]SMC49887.1 Histidine kinase-, DNA gyrase B-, and HSP90-like ATPase [Tropicibacter naphthalenivorans]
MRQTLQRLGLFNGAPEVGFDALCSLSASVLGTDGAALTIFDFETDKLSVKSVVGLNGFTDANRVYEIGTSLGKYAISRPGAWGISDTREHALAQDIIDAGQDVPQAYLGARVYLPERQPIGVLSVASSTPRHWTEQDKAMLSKVADCVSNEIRRVCEADAARRLRIEQRDLSYALSHDLRAPSNTLRMILQEFEAHRDQLPEDLLMFLDQGQISLDRMGAQVAKVLDYSRIIARPREREAIDLNIVCAAAMVDLRTQIVNAQADIEIEDLPTVEGDFEQLRVVFENLLSNAIKFRRPDVPVRVRVTRQDMPDARRHCIQISDNGLGIPVEFQKKVFELFVRLHLHEDYPGSGLGLTLCRQLVESHYGILGLTSDGATGSEFSIWLPMRSE